MDRVGPVERSWLNSQHGNRSQRQGAWASFEPSNQVAAASGVQNPTLSQPLSWRERGPGAPYIDTRLRLSDDTRSISLLYGSKPASKGSWSTTTVSFGFWLVTCTRCM